MCEKKKKKSSRDKSRISIKILNVKIDVPSVIRIRPICVDKLLFSDFDNHGPCTVTPDFFINVRDTASNLVKVVESSK